MRRSSQSTLALAPLSLLSLYSPRQKKNELRQFMFVCCHFHVSRVAELRCLIIGVRAEYVSRATCAYKKPLYFCLFKKKNLVSFQHLPSSSFMRYITAARRRLTSGDVTGVGHISKVSEENAVEDFLGPLRRDPGEGVLGTNVKCCNRARTQTTSSVASLASSRTWRLFCPSDVLLPDPVRPKRSSTF